MHSFLALGMLITLCASASAATVHHSRTHQSAFIPPSVASSFAAVPRWAYLPIRYNDPSQSGGEEALPGH